MTLRAVLHLLLHAAVPALVAWGIYRGSGRAIGFRRAWGLLLLGWLIDIDVMTQ